MSKFNLQIVPMIPHYSINFHACDKYLKKRYIYIDLIYKNFL